MFTLPISKTLTMKKNILGAIVIFFVTFACLLAISEASNKKASDTNIEAFYTHN